jgi:glycosyltransferase involved in cell wall biosynthesis
MSGSAIEDMIVPELDPELVRSVSRKVTIVDETWAHHSAHSGYRHFIDHIPDAATVPYVMRDRWHFEHRHTRRGRVSRLHVGDHDLPLPFVERVLGRVLRNRPWYPAEVLVAELRILARMALSTRTIYHLTYAEEQYGILGEVRWPRRAKVIGTFHQPPSQIHKFFPSDSPLRRLDGAIAVSTNQLSTLNAWLGPERVFLVPHGVDTAFWAPGHGGASKHATFTVLSVGKWLRDFDAMRWVAESLRRSLGEAVELVVVAPPDQASHIAAWEGVRVLVGISEDELRAWYRSADLTLIPLLDGTVNNTMLESLACATPVVASDVGAVSDLADSLGVLAVTPRDGEAMAHAVLSVLEGVETDARATAARRTAEALDWSVVARRLLGVYAALAV